MCKFKLDIETIKSKMRKFLAEHKFESEEMKPKENELIYLPPTKHFCNAVRFCVEKGSCTAEMLQQHFGISTYQIMKLIYAMEVLELITPKDEDGESRKVLPNAKEFLQYMENISEREYFELKDFRYFKTRTEYEKRSGGLEDCRQCVIEEDTLKEIVFKNGVYLINDYKNLTWCEVGTNDNTCFVQIFNRNIPVDYRGGKDETHSFSVVCKDSNEAKYCAKMLSDLVFSGYKMRYSWFLPMDIADLESFFSKETKFIHFEPQPILDMASKILDIEKVHEVLVYIRVNTNFTEKGFDASISSMEESFSAFYNHLCIGTWVQISLNDDTAGAPFEVDVWYR